MSYLLRRILGLCGSSVQGRSMLINSRPNSNYQAPPRDRERDTSGQPPSAPAQQIDHYLPPQATLASAVPRPPKQKNSFLMMSFGPDPSRPSGTARHSNPFAHTSKTPPTGPKNSAPIGPAITNSSVGGSSHRSLPWPSSTSNSRTSTASDLRRGSASEYQRFQTSYQSLRSVQGEEGDSDEGPKLKPRSINVLAWDLP
jgi:hypothetical protein